uniref:Uncharacterized protein n=1 Tax=Rhizophora mucronata TaxID=61149 RepID=A0A2P2PIY9_RHIMU
MTDHPLTGTEAVFFIGGSSRLNLDVSVLGLKFPKPSATI